jgi:hypothetical protein
MYLIVLIFLDDHSYLRADAITTSPPSEPEILHDIGLLDLPVQRFSCESYNR